ncbi:phage terminase large subunit [Aminobacter sp. MDW-2]|uniref:phage terminase large subunit n=1 Tax=Aminobacter sp. MDW-2 TaxID=2666139 RepID=UPI00163CF204|nr:phage terminase large subunit [Aminobacter sp. MDW-2]QNH35629.1 phage terminase large subunit [Aminobacter sp. MDW-2]
MSGAQPTLIALDNPSQFLAELRRRSLSAFVGSVFGELNGDGYQPNWHIDAIAWHLEEVERGALKRLIITLPPRHLKSFAASIAFPAWVLGRDPTRKVISISYSQDLTKSLSNEFRRVLDLPLYASLFPKTRLSKTKNTEIEQKTTSGGFRYATSVDGTLTGRGGDFIIIDDPIKAGSVMSDAERTAVNTWYHNSVVSRLDSKKDGAIVIVMQRLHENDLVGHLTERDDHSWTVLNIPAIATVDTIYRTGNGLNNRTYHRRAGELIQQDREGQDHLDALRQDIGTHQFSAQYQQEPIPLTGNLIRRDWLRSYRTPPKREEFDLVAQSWDTASSAEEQNDFSVCTTWGVKGKQLYLLDLCRKKLEYPDLRKEALRLARQFRPGIILIERAGTGFALLKDLPLVYRDAYLPKSTPRGDKVSRVAGVSSLIEQGRVLIPEVALWRGEFLKEVLAFPGSRHDDQVDSMEQFLRFMQSLGNRILRFDPTTGQRIRERRDVINRR